MSSVYAIVVTYNPDVSRLTQQINSVAPQVNKIIIVDNASHNREKLAHTLGDGIIFIKNSQNKGVATALNQGIDMARANDAKYALLLDQDSLPEFDMVSKLINALEREDSLKANVIAAGPNYSDVKTKTSAPFVKISGLKLTRISAKPGDIIDVDHLISSGSLVKLADFEKVGHFENQLFIDYVDTEWCLRAKNKGYRLIGVADAHMLHDLGDDFLQLLGRKIPLHSPLRHYYMIRNSIWLMRRPWITWQWRALDTLRMVQLFIIFSIFSSSRLKNFTAMLKGVADGLRGRMDKL